MDFAVSRIRRPKPKESSPSMTGLPSVLECCRCPAESRAQIWLIYNLTECTSENQVATWVVCGCMGRLVKRNFELLGEVGCHVVRIFHREEVSAEIFIHQLPGKF